MGPNGVNSKKEIYFGPIKGNPEITFINLIVTCASFIFPDMNKTHVITPAVDSVVAPESAEKRAPKRGG